MNTQIDTGAPSAQTPAPGGLTLLTLIGVDASTQRFKDDQSVTPLAWMFGDGSDEDGITLAGICEMGTDQVVSYDNLGLDGDHKAKLAGISVANGYALLVNTGDVDNAKLIGDAISLNQAMHARHITTEAFLTKGGGKKTLNIVDIDDVTGRNLDFSTMMAETETTDYWVQFDKSGNLVLVLTAAKKPTYVYSVNANDVGKLFEGDEVDYDNFVLRGTLGIPLDATLSRLAKIGTDGCLLVNVIDNGQDAVSRVMRFGIKHDGERTGIIAHNADYPVEGKIPAGWNVVGRANDGNLNLMNADGTAFRQIQIQDDPTLTHIAERWKTKTTDNVDEVDQDVEMGMKDDDSDGDGTDDDALTQSEQSEDDLTG